MITATSQHGRNRYTSDIDRTLASVKLTPKVIRCPAGEFVTETLKGPGCRCRITRDTLTAVEDGGSLKAFCAGKYTACPVWQREKEAIAERKRAELHSEIASVDPTPDRPK